MQSKILTAIEKFLPEYPNMHGEVAIAYEHEIVYYEKFSYSDAPWETYKQAQYLIGSITKQFTAVALLKSLYDKKNSLSRDAGELKSAIQDELQKPILSFLPSSHKIWLVE